MQRKEIPEAAGTPMPVKTPINFLVRKAQAQEANKKALRKLLIVSFVSIFFIIAQSIGGWLSGSIAIFTDTAHLASDLIGFAISIASLNLAQKKADKSLSFGYHRAEVIGTLVSIIFIWGLTVWLLKEATQRFWIDFEIEGNIMLITAVAGLFFNLIQMKILHSGDGHYHLGGGHDHAHGDHNHDHGHGHSHSHSHGEGHVHKHPPKAKKVDGNEADNEQLTQKLLPDEHHHEHDHAHGDEHHHHEHHEHDHAHDHDNEKKGKKQAKNINVESAFLHVLGDMLMSVGVIIAAVIIRIDNRLKVADPICTYLFSVILCFTTIPIFKSCIRVMMEGTPDEVDTEELLTDIYNVSGVEEIHDFHIWSISVGKLALSVHVKSDTPLKTLSLITDLMRRKYGLYHTTIQMEGFTETKHSFKCENDIHE